MAALGWIRFGRTLLLSQPVGLCTRFLSQPVGLCGGLDARTFRLSRRVDFIDLFVAPFGAVSWAVSCDRRAFIKSFIDLFGLKALA